MSLTRRLVDLHSGRISLESEPGKGSVFTFRIPLGGIEVVNGIKIGDRMKTIRIE